jgi:hypothetical protein
MQKFWVRTRKMTRKSDEDGWVSEVKLMEKRREKGEEQEVNNNRKVQWR